MAAEGIMATDKKNTPVTMYANYQFSITDKQQGEWQTFLRLMPEAAQNSPVWEMIHSLSYTQSWTESPAHTLWKAAETRPPSTGLTRSMASDSPEDLVVNRVAYAGAKPPTPVRKNGK
jgi:hypothetical protein